MNSILNLSALSTMNTKSQYHTFVTLVSSDKSLNPQLADVDTCNALYMALYWLDKAEQLQHQIKMLEERIERLNVGMATYKRYSNESVNNEVQTEMYYHLKESLNKTLNQDLTK